MTAAGLWDRVQAFYARPGIAAACLALQDQHGADVTLLLFLLARAESGQRLDADKIARLAAALEHWRAGIIAPLRALRRGLKAPPPGFEVRALRELVASAELEAERLQLRRLESLEPDAPAPLAPAEAAEFSLSAYAAVASFPAAALGPLLALFEAMPAP